jgi:hypothetical protein
MLITILAENGRDSAIEECDEKGSSHDEESSPSSVPNDKNHMQVYLKDLCEYGEYQRFVDAVFAYTVS